MNPTGRQASVATDIFYAHQLPLGSAGRTLRPSPKSVPTAGEGPSRRALRTSRTGTRQAFANGDPLRPDETRNPGADDSAERTVLPPRAELDPEATSAGGFEPVESPVSAPVGSARPLLGVVAIYSPTAGEPTTPPSQAGRSYTLYEGDVLFVGKEEPQDLPLQDGGVLRITHAHILPRDNEYTHVSREHLALQMLPGGRFRIYDYSLNGVFLETGQRHLQRGKLRPQTTDIGGRENLVLGINLLELTDRQSRKSAARSRVQVVPVGDDVAHTAESEATR